MVVAELEKINGRKCLPRLLKVAKAIQGAVDVDNSLHTLVNLSAPAAWEGFVAK